MISISLARAGTSHCPRNVAPESLLPAPHRVSRQSRERRYRRAPLVAVHARAGCHRVPPRPTQRPQSFESPMLEAYEQPPFLLPRSGAVQARPGLESAWFQRFKPMKRNLLSNRTWFLSLRHYTSVSGCAQQALLRAPRIRRGEVMQVEHTSSTPCVESACV